jgi:tetratricopeptide (TPR) repeat protein
MDERLLVNDQDGSLKLFEQARNEMEAGRYENAIAHFEESNHIQPNYKTCLLLGDCLMRLQRFRDAVIPLAAATTLNRQGIAPTLLAETFLALDDASRAYEYVKIAIERQPHYKRAQDFEPIAREARECWLRELSGDRTENAEGV